MGGIEKMGEWRQKKQENKQNGGTGGKQRTSKKNPNGVEGKKKNQKKDFHKMTTKFNNLSQIQLTPSDGNQNGFGRHQIQLPPLDDEQNGFNCHH